MPAEGFRRVEPQEFDESLHGPIWRVEYDEYDAFPDSGSISQGSHGVDRIELGEHGVTVRFGERDFLHSGETLFIPMFRIDFILISEDGDADER